MKAIEEDELFGFWMKRKGIKDRILVCIECYNTHAWEVFWDRVLSSKDIKKADKRYFCGLCGIEIGKDYQRS